MFSRIIAPVDGSQLAEAVLPYVRVLARAFKSKVTLLQATQGKAAFPAWGILSAVQAAEILELARRRADEYLKGLVPSMEGLQMDYKVKMGRPEEVIAEEARRANGSNLIAMSTHGRSGIGRWIIGSVTDKVLHIASNSMLVVRPTQKENQSEGEAHLTRIILPLDGSELSDQALSAATELARELSLQITLVRVVSTVQLAMAGEWPAGYPDMLEEVENDARCYLQTKEQELKDQGVQQVDSQMVRGDGAAQIVDLARRYTGTLVVMTTRGRSGLGRAIMGSVADRVVCNSGAPVLLVRT